MNILYIITQANGGGAQNYVLTLARHFNGDIAAGNESSTLFQEAVHKGQVCHSLSHLKRAINPWNDFLAILEIRQLIQNLKPDIVHFNSSKAGVLGSFASIGLKCKVIYTAHGFVFNEPLSWPIKSFYLALEKIASSYRDHIIAVSGADREVGLKFGLISPNKISVVYNGIMPISFLSQQEARLKLNLTADKVIVGTVANFYKTKGLDILVEAVNLLPANIKDKCHFVILGDGPEKNNIKSMLENLKLTALFTLPGGIENADTYVKAFDVFVLPSRKEGFPYSILEAIQAELPIIASDVGGIPEALETAGILIPPEDPKALARQIEDLVSNPNQRQELSKKALIRAGEFTEEKMLKETEEIYKKVINR